MIVKTENREIKVKNIYSEIMKTGFATYPALRFEFEGDVLSADVAELMSGALAICDDEGNVLSQHDGYKTLKDISVTIGKITTVEAERDELKVQLVAKEQENAEISKNLETIEKERTKFQKQIQEFEIERINLQQSLETLRMEKMDLEANLNTLKVEK